MFIPRFFCGVIRGFFRLNTFIWIIIASPLLKLLISPNNTQIMPESNQPVKEIQESANTMPKQENNESPTITKDNVDNDTTTILNETIHKDEEKLEIQEKIEDSEYAKLDDNVYKIQNTYSEKYKFGNAEVEPIFGQKFWNYSDYALREVKHGAGIGETKKSYFGGLFGTNRVSKYNGAWTAKNGSGKFIIEVFKPIPLKGITFSTKSNPVSYTHLTLPTTERV